MASAEPPSITTGEPDIMNDPSYQTNSKGKENSSDELDTCRICRGEGSTNEPLFYPCKCSGSIKFVHQGCLMEWLSHSQKKHCELCKTSFRFTKLYHPQMPGTVPLPIFLRQAAVHTFRSFLTWARWHLVLFVWLGWVPWCMRTVWRGLFWIGDGGWIDWREFQKKSTITAQEQLEKLMSSVTSSASPIAITSDDAAASDVALAISKVLSPKWGSLTVSQAQSFSGVEPRIFRFTKNLLRGLFYQRWSGSVSANSTVSQNITRPIRFSSRSPSLLSDLGFLGTLTRWPTMNNLIIDVLEGQLITLLVVVAFVLIFLIREWVVQQQPAINMGEAFNAAAVAGEGQEADGPVQQQIDGQGIEQGIEVAPQRDDDNDNGNVMPPPAGARRARLLAVPRPARRLRVPPGGPDGEGNGALPLDENGGDRCGESQFSTSLGLPNSSMPGRPRSASDAGPSTLFQRPGMPTRDALACATEIQRTMEEHTRASGQNWPGINVFMDLWNRAESKPSEVLKIIRDEGREEELGWIVLAMRRLESTDSEDTLGNEYQEANGASLHTTEGPPSERQSNASNESWQVVEDVARTNLGTSPATEHPSNFLQIQEQQIRPLKRETQNHFSIAEEEPDIPEKTLENSNQDISKDPSGITSDTSPADIDRVVQDNVPEIPTTRDEPHERQGKDQHQQQPISQEQWDFSGLGELPSDSVPNHSEGSSPTTRLPDAETVSDESIDSIPELIQSPPAQQDLDSGYTSEPSAISNTNTEVVTAAIGAQSLTETVMEWLWGGIAQAGLPPEDPGEDDEHVVRDVQEEPPFVHMARGQLVVHGGNDADNIVEDPEVLRAAAEAGLDLNDAEAIDDGEDLEGVMELIGMQGPIAGLVQNGMFSAVLISLTVFFGIWIPYIAGKLLLVFLANPISLFVKLPLRWASTIADLIIDTCVFVAACAFFWTDTAIKWIVTPVGLLVPFLGRINNNNNSVLSATAWSYGSAAGERLVKMFELTSDSFVESDIPAFSIIAHESLKKAEQRLTEISVGSVALMRNMTFIQSNQTASAQESWNQFGHLVFISFSEVFSLINRKRLHAMKMAPSLLNINPLRISLDIPQRTQPLDYSLASWNTRDRIVAIILGYVSFSIAGALYLRIRAVFQDKRDQEQAQGTFVDILNQAAGVMKVILIIGIEMIVFPLYCGLLLDGALLPLFDNASVLSRISFTIDSPYTSIFIHWFVGTCYMFHFALFVSMCRKIMRTGVLCKSGFSAIVEHCLTEVPDFIRDPDDPTFHPVRDVLERNVSTQLRKIAFSALVYGALVIICLGTIVWSLAFAVDGVFPIHWSSNEPVLEFPVDLLVYNFLMPLAVKFLKPSNGLTKMYDWWFRKCARMLRLSQFLFGEQKDDEEGHHVRRTWWDALAGKRGDPTMPIRESRKFLAEDRDMDVYFLRDGRYVRAPASDQVRIPKDSETFLEVDEDGDRIDGLPDKDDGLHGRENKMFTKLYIPPYFRFRIGAFIVLIWLFASTTGVGITVIPLLFGRYIFARLIPNHLRMNDIYAFSIGIYLLGGPLYLLFHYRHRLSSIAKNAHHIISASPPPFSTLLGSLRSTAHYAILALRFLYFYSALTILLPSLFALLMETYLVIPLHTYFSPPSTTSSHHTIHFVQDWTLGVLYLKMAGRLILWHANGRPAMALRAIVAGPAHNWLRPDVRLATRAVIFPATLVMVFGLTAPLGVGWLANKTVFMGPYATVHQVVYRYSYPVVAGLAVGTAGCVALAKALGGWRGRVRDEVYLIGERLHNFGERRGGVGAGSRVVASG
ncbi:hypothetical protein MMC17_000679 [Xylographa soralifera]|nr:hypothetical protein [Xylographa soralifera]